MLCLLLKTGSEAGSQQYLSLALLLLDYTYNLLMNFLSSCGKHTAVNNQSETLKLFWKVVKADRMR